MFPLLISKERLDRLRSHIAPTPRRLRQLQSPAISYETNAEIRVTSIQSDRCTENAVRASLSFVVSPTPISRDLSPTRRVGDNIAKNR